MVYSLIGESQRLDIIFAKCMPHISHVNIEIESSHDIIVNSVSVSYP